MTGARTLVATVALVVLGLSPAAADVEVSASVDHERVFVGEPFRLSVQVEGSQRVEPPSVEMPDGFDLRFIGPTTRYSSLNGRVSSSVTYSYFVTPRREGRFTLGPFRVTVDGQAHETEPIAVLVSAAANARPPSDGGNTDGPLRMVVTPDKTVAYVGETLGLRLDLYIGDVAVDNLHFPDLQAEGFAVDAFGQPSRREEIVKLRRWTVLSFRSALTPLRAGALTLGPATMKLDVVEGGRGSGFFDQFLGRRRSVSVRAEAVPVEVKALPETGRPAGFSGAVGKFEMRVTASPSQVRAGDPVTLHAEISGSGNLRGVDLPRLTAEDDRLRVYDPTVVGKAGEGGKLTVEQVVIPRDGSVREIPALRFSFFEPQAERYVTVASGPFPLTVSDADAKTAPQVLSAATEPAAAPVHEQLERDIVYIKERPGALKARSDVVSYRTLGFVALQVVPPLFVLLQAGLGHHRRRRAAGSERLRFQRAGKIAKRELRALARDDTDGFYDELTAILARYLAAKLELPPGSVERSVVRASLEHRSASWPARAAVDDYFDRIERLRYAPSASRADDRETVWEKAHAVVAALEGERTIAYVARRVVALGVVSVLCASSAVVAEEDKRDPVTVFHDGNAAYRAGDYAGAVREYRALGERFESAALLYNLGNACFKQRALGEAILWYERAARLGPRDPDTRANLALARELAKAPVEELTPWQRVLLAPAFAFSAAELAVAWTVLWWSFCAVWMEVRRRRARAGLVWAAGLVAGLVGASLVWRLTAVEFRDTAIVIAAGRSSALFEPSPAGKEHFAIVEGSRVEIRERREGWVQVASTDGLRGWLPAASVEPIRR